MSPEQQLTFLIADNDLQRLDNVTTLIHEMGYQTVLQAEDGPEAWAMIKNFTVDIIVSNWKLPEIDGLALLKLIRSNDDFAETPFVMVAAEVTAKTVSQAGRTGVTDIVVFPFTEETLKSRVRLVVEVEQNPQHQEAERKYKQGVDLMKAGHYNEALKSFEGILSVHEPAEVYYNMGYILSAKENYEEALQCFRRATVIKNDFARAYKQMAEALMKLGRKQEAEECFEEAADIYMERKQDQEAEDIFEAVTKLKPDTINVFNSLGIIYRRQGRLKEALEQYVKALKVHPRDENIFYNLGRVHAELKEFGPAREALMQALKLKPDFSAAREMLRAVDMGLSLHS